MDMRKCIICRKETYRVVLFKVRDQNGFSHELVKCSNCGLVWLDSLPFHQQHLIEVLEDRNSTARARPLEQIMYFFHCLRLRRLAEMGKIDGRLLDVGCGKGKFLATARKDGYEVQGIEPSAQRTEFARRHYRLAVTNGTLDTVCFPDKYFDIVTLWHVLEHIPNPIQHLKKIHRILKNDGVLLVAVPNIDSFQARIGGVDWFHLGFPQHLFHYSPTTLARVLQMSGFRIKRVWHFSLENNLVGAIMTALNILGCSRNFLFRLLRREPVKDEMGFPLFVCNLLVSFLVCMVFGIPLTLLIYLEAALRRGATIDAGVSKI